MQHTISDNEILMQIHPGDSPMPESPSHATLSFETENPETKEKQIRRYRFMSSNTAWKICFIRGMIINYNYV